MLSLSLMLVLLLLGLAFLYRRQAQYRAAAAAPWQAQARALCQAGLEDCRLKWQKDPDFPPRSSEDQQYFNYSEELKDDSGLAIGRFAVTVDFRLAAQPYKLARVTSVGIVPASGAPVAQHKIMVEFDLSDVVRGTSDPNPKYFQYINWKDLGNL
ncbi:hypothetical protein JST97_23000 [bacterium]|nr:hypothetical protein [bacterium]